MFETEFKENLIHLLQRLLLEIETLNQRLDSINETAERELRANECDPPSMGDARRVVAALSALQASDPATSGGRRDEEEGAGRPDAVRDPD